MERSNLLNTDEWEIVEDMESSSSSEWEDVESIPKPVERVGFRGAGVTGTWPKPDIRTQAIPGMEHFDIADSVARVVGGGLLNLVRGTATLPFDVGAALGYEKESSQEVSDFVSKLIPRIPPKTKAEDLLQTLVHYGIPASAAVRLATGITRGSMWAIRVGADLLGGGLADFIATPGSVKKRAFAGATDIAFSGGLGAVGGTVKFGYGLAKNIFHPSKVAEEAARGAFRSAALDPEAAIAELKEVLRREYVPGYKPTSGVASGDYGLTALEKGIGTKDKQSPIFVERKELNMRSVSNALEEITQRHGGDPTKAKEYFENYLNAKLTGAANAQELAESTLKGAEDETDNLINGFVKQGGGQAEASAIIDESLREELERMTRTKNRLFKEIDPTNSVEIPKDDLREAYQVLVGKQSPLDSVPSKIDKGLKSRIFRILKPPQKSVAERPLTYGALQDLRPDLSAAIARARRQEEGGLVERLVGFKATVEEETEKLAARGGPDAQRAYEALDYFKNEFVPKFKEGVAGKFRQAIRRGEPWPPSATGKRFLGISSGAQESANQLRNIIRGSQDPSTTMGAVRTHIIGDVADLMRGSAGKTSLTRLDNYLNKREVRETIDRFPSIKNEILEFRNNIQKGLEAQGLFAASVEAAKKGVMATQKEANLSAARYFVNRDPENAIKQALNSSELEATFGKLAQLAKQDPTGDAMRGLRQALSNHIDSLAGVRGTREVAGSLEIIRSRLAKMMEDKKTRGALSKLYGSTEMKVLESLNKQLQIEDRINKQMTAGSPTAPIQETVKRARIILSSWYGLVRGRGIMAISGWIQKTVGKDPQEMAETLISDAMLDPRLAIEFLRPDNKANRARTMSRFMRHMLNNYAFNFNE